MRSARGVGTVTDVQIERVGVLSTLAGYADLPLVVISAGAGFGKSTLAAQWAERDVRPHATVRVGRYMDDPRTLAMHLVDALDSLGADAGDTRTVVTGAEPRFSAVALPALTRLAELPAEPYVLVVDDIHLLTDPDCHAVLQAVAAGIPPGSQLALLSRVEIPEAVARARAERRLVEIGSTDLAFSDAESRQFLSALDIPLSGAQVDRLVAQSEGWPVGLYLMALATDGDDTNAAPAMAPGVPHRYVLDYIRGEVLSGLAPRTRQFLRQTSVVDELDVRLCDALVRRHDSARVLSDLVRQLQLVVALDAKGLRYRYHHLLSDALRVDLTEHEPWLEAELHRRASAWYEAEGDMDRAVAQAHDADDLPRVSRLVWAGVPACIASGHPDRLRGWLDRLDESRIRSDPWLTLSAAWLGLQSGDESAMTRWLLSAEVHAGPDWHRRAGEDSYAAALAAIHVTVGDFGLRGTMELCRGIQAKLPHDSGFRAAAFLNEGVVLTLTRQPELGLAKFLEAERLSRALRVPVIEANSLVWQGLVALLDDDWTRAAPLVAQADTLVRRHHLDRLATSANIITTVALLHAARGSKAEARSTLAVARRLTGQAHAIAPWYAVVGPLVQARVAILLGDGALARGLCAEARSHLTADLADTLLGDFLEATEALLRNVRTEGIAPGTLTPSELRILQFLPSRLTFPQIGEHLFISQNTVKTHAHSIYRKLGTSSRNETIERARALGLIESPPGG